MNEDTGPVTAVAATKGVLATGSSDGAVRIWDIGLQSLRHTISGQGEAISRIVLTDAGTVTSADAAGRIKVWRLTNDAMPRTYRRHTGEVRCLAYSPNGRRLASGSDDGMVYLWPQRGPEARSTPRYETAVAAVVFLDDNRLLAAAGNSAWIWTLDSDLAPIECNGHADLVTAAAAAADGRSILTGSLDGSARLWETAGGQTLQVFNQHQGAVRAVAFLPDGRQAVSAGDDGNVRFWDLTTGAATGGFDGGAPVSAVAVGAQGVLAVGYRDGGCEVRQLDSTVLWRRMGHDAAVTDMTFSADGRRLFSGSADQLTRVWEVTGGDELFTIPGKNPVRAVALSPDNLKLALAGSGRDVRVWQALPWFDTNE
jgi:WD40 repeat protein